MSESAKSSPAHSNKSELFDEVPSSPDQTVIAGWLKFRDQKKWKLRWGVVTKLSPAADCLHLQLYRDIKDRYMQGMTKASLSLDHFLGTESGFTLDKESNSLAIVCRDLIVVLAFDSRERLIQWQMKMQYNLGESTQFLVQISSTPAKSKLNNGPAKMHIQNQNFCITCGVPPKLIGYWEIKHLRRYGVVDGKFCFEGGSLCGKGEGLFVFLTDECEQISWNMQMASEGKLIPKRRHMSRNMSVIESPSRRYIQRPSDSYLSSIGNLSSMQDNQSVIMYEWASEDSTKDTYSEGKNSSDYSCSLQSHALSGQWSEFNVEKFAEAISSHFSDDKSKSNYEEYDPTKKFLKLNSCDDAKSKVASDKQEESGLKVPERPPKPLKFRPLESETVIKSVQEKTTLTDNISPDKLDSAQSQKNRNNETENVYDMPVTFSSKLRPKMDDHSCACLEQRKNSINEMQSKTSSNNYDIPPMAVPINTVCSCTSKMKVIVQAEEFHNYKYSNSCPCQHFIACWPYNWLQLAYCRRGNSIQDAAIPFKVVGYPDSKVDNGSPLYAQVDLSKKTKYKHASDVSFDSERLNEQKPKLPVKPPKSEPNNSYTNMYFENTLKYYENSKELIQNMLRNEESSVERNDSKELCTDNYIIMNPLCVGRTKTTSTTKVMNTNTELNKSFLIRQRSDSLGSSRSHPVLGTRHMIIKTDESKKFADDIRMLDLTRYKSKSSVNRDSSSSNDSGFSLTSSKSHVGETTEGEHILNLMRNNSFSADKIATKNSNILKISDPLKDISFNFHLASLPSSTADIPLCHQKISKKNSDSIKSDGVSIPFIDAQSTSSETSDISDYIETLSMSSHSSSEANSHSRMSIPVHHSPSSTVLRPRSGKEYEKVNRVLLQQ